MNMNRKTLAYDALLLIAAMGLYAPSLWYEFIGDDLVYFIGNPVIRSFDALTILRSGAIGADYLPLRDLSFAFDSLVWGGNPFGFHLTNLLLYGITVVCVRRLFTALNEHLAGREDERFLMPAFLAALLFAVHPFHREVVCAVYNRGTLLTALFCVLACIAYLKHLRGSGRAAYALALFSYVLALLSREYGIILPLLLALIAAFGGRDRLAARLAGLLPFFLCGALFYAVYRRFAVEASFIAADETLLADLANKAATAFRIAAFYFVRMITFSGRMDVTEGGVFAAVSALATAGFLAGFVLARRARPQLLFGYLFYLICLLPVLNFYRTLPVVAVRYAYLPCVGLFFMMTSFPWEGWKRLVHAAALAAVLALSFTTTYQMKYYASNIGYWEFIASYERNGFISLQLGYAYLRGREYAKAFEALCSVSPMPQEDPVYYAAIGDACLNLGDYRCAANFLEKAVLAGGKDGRTVGMLIRARQGLEGNPAPR